MGEKRGEGYARAHTHVHTHSVTTVSVNASDSIGERALEKLVELEACAEELIESTWGRKGQLRGLSFCVFWPLACESAPSILRIRHILAPINGPKGCCLHSCWELRPRHTGYNSGAAALPLWSQGSRVWPGVRSSRPPEVPTQPPRLYSHRVSVSLPVVLRCHLASSLGDPHPLAAEISARHQAYSVIWVCLKSFLRPRQQDSDPWNAIAEGLQPSQMLLSAYNPHTQPWALTQIRVL